MCIHTRRIYFTSKLRAAGEPLEPVNTSRAGMNELLERDVTQSTTGRHLPRSSRPRFWSSPARFWSSSSYTFLFPLCLVLDSLFPALCLLGIAFALWCFCSIAFSVSPLVFSVECVLIPLAALFLCYLFFFGGYPLPWNYRVFCLFSLSRNTSFLSS